MNKKRLRIDFMLGDYEIDGQRYWLNSFYNYYKAEKLMIEEYNKYFYKDDPYKKYKGEDFDKKDFIGIISLDNKDSDYYEFSDVYSIIYNDKLMRTELLDKEYTGNLSKVKDIIVKVYDVDTDNKLYNKYDQANNSLVNIKIFCHCGEQLNIACIKSSKDIKINRDISIDYYVERHECDIQGA